MSRLTMALALLTVGAAGAIYSQSFEVQAAPEEVSGRQPLVLLDDGSTMISPRGGPDHSWLRWLTEGEIGSARFAFGSDAFVDDRDALNSVGLGRAVQLGMLLRSAPDAKLLLPQSKGDSMAASRAETLAKFLKGRGILADQVMFGTTEFQPSDNVPFLLTRREPAT